MLSNKKNSNGHYIVKYNQITAVLNYMLLLSFSLLSSIVTIDYNIEDTDVRIFNIAIVDLKTRLCYVC